MEADENIYLPQNMTSGEKREVDKYSITNKLYGLP